MQSDLFQRINNILESAKEEGEKKLSNGVRLIRPALEIAPKAWTHIFFPPLQLEKIKEIENKLCRKLPIDLAAFFQYSNGLSLFSNNLVIWGMRNNYSRTGDDIWQPFDLVDHNSMGEKPKGSPQNTIFFGSLERGRFWLFFETENNHWRVGKTIRQNFNPLQYWDTFDEWFFEELNNLLLTNK